MPQVIGPIQAAIVSVQGFIVQGLVNVGLSKAAAWAVVDLVTQVVVVSGISYATAALTRPPTPEAGKSTVRQERPPRMYGFGRCRVSGPFMLRETNVTVLGRVIALPEGPVDHYGQFWLNDDAVSFVSGGIVQGMADGRYPEPKTVFDWRYGLDTETAYADAITEFPGIWTSSHRGDGIPSLWLYTKNGDRDKFNRDFPNGEPDPSVEAFYAAYDWRDDAQDRDDKTTWTFSANPVVIAVNVLWRRFGADWNRRFAPVLDQLTIEADYCDEAVDLKAGGTEARYECGGFFSSQNAMADVMGVIMASMDGWWATRRDGAYIIRAGRYYEPTVTFGDAEVLDYSFDPGPTPDAARNVLVVSFTDPANAYSKVETTPWRNEADITQRGEERSQDFYPHAVQSNGQVRRLGKRALAKVLSSRITVRTPLSARRGLGERYVGLNVSECADLSGATLEVSEAQIDLSTSSILWSGVLADPDIDGWDPDTEEGDGPSAVERPGNVAFVTPPEILDATGGAGEANVTIRFPLDSLSATVSLYRDTDSGFAGATVVEADMVGSLGEVRIINDTGLLADDYWYFARASDGLGNVSVVVSEGPITVT